MSLIRKHVAVLQAWACLALVDFNIVLCNHSQLTTTRFRIRSSTWQSTHKILTLLTSTPPSSRYQLSTTTRRNYDTA